MLGGTGSDKLYGGKGKDHLFAQGNNSGYNDSNITEYKNTEAAWVEYAGYADDDTAIVKLYGGDLLFAHLNIQNTEQFKRPEFNY